MIKVIDTFDMILDMNVGDMSDASEFLDSWREYLSDYPALADLCYKDALGYDFEADCMPIIRTAISDRVKLCEVHENFIEVTKRMEMGHYFDIDACIEVYFIIGLCNGAGWATMLGDKYIVLVGVEKLIELGWYTQDKIEALISHELCHHIHSLLRGEDIDILFEGTWTSDVALLYTEGFAQFYQQRLMGRVYHQQDVDGWIEWCGSNFSEICSEYLRRVEGSVDISDFFGDWNSYRGRSDVGYYLGSRWIGYLDEVFSVEEIARLSYEEVKGRVKNILLAGSAEVG